MGRKRGPISKKIRNLCYDLKNGIINDSTFKDEIKAIINEYGEKGTYFKGLVWLFRNGAKETSAFGGL